MYSIISSAGGFGNHLRWLMLMSPNFNDLNGISSPSKLKTGVMFPLNGEGKVAFINKYVYHYTRTAFNWLEYEHKFRTQLNDTIFFEHVIANYTFNKTRKNKEHNKIIIARCEPNESLFFYCKFMPYLNHSNISGFIENCKFQLGLIDNFVRNDNEEVLLIDSKQLYKKELDYNLYKTLVDFYQIEDSYKFAKEIHESWFNLQEKSLNDVLDILDTLSIDNFPWNYSLDDDKGRLNTMFIQKNYYENLARSHNEPRTKLAIENLKHTYQKVTQ